MIDKELESPVRFSIRQLLAAVTTVAVVLGIVSLTGSIVLGIHLSLALVGWVLYRYAHGYLGGIVPALLGWDAMLCMAVDWVIRANEDFLGVRAMFFMFAGILAAMGIAILIWIGTRKQKFWKNQIAIAGVLFVLFITSWIAIPTLGNIAISRRQASDFAANKLATSKAIALLEEHLRKTGEMPEAKLLTEQLGEPLPAIRWEGRFQEIQYSKTSATTYELQYFDPSGFMGDIVIYDSSTPKRGWYRIPF